MDAKLTPYVDVVGDVHAMPFKADSVDFFFALAVIEHLRNPFVAAAEIFQSLKPGGYVYGDCNFVFPYHGYPHHYFNASIHGLKEAFGQFRQLRLGVPPFQMPSFTLNSVLTTYLNMLPIENESEQEFADLARKVLEYPLRYYDTKLGPEISYRLAAGNYFVGIKQPKGRETTIPPVVMRIYATSAELQKRFPDPSDLSKADNLMLWAKGEGSRVYPEIAAYFRELQAFSKYVDGKRRPDRSKIRQYSIPQDPSDQRAIITPEEIARYRNGAGKRKRPRKRRGPFYKFKTRVLATLRS
jgi:hypothetical protein